MPRSFPYWLFLVAGCSTTDASEDPAPTSVTLTPTLTESGSGTDSSGTGATGGSSDPSAPSISGGETDETADTTAASGGDCTFCTAPNQACVNEMCVTTCQGQSPDPCGPDQVCDHITGGCVDSGQTCTLSGDYTPCGESRCGPGSVCDDQGECIPYPPCAGVACTEDGGCWGTFCSCERNIACEPPSDALLNGGFGVEISDLEFADDCTAWMVTLRSGTDFVRRLTPDGELTEWAGVSNLNMGEIAVLKSLTPPAAAALPLGLGAHPLPPPEPVEGLGEVAITYICCSTCGCFTDPPQGVARLVEDDMVQPLPLVIPAVATDATGPFGTAAADAGPFGLTWGIDRVLYVGNSTANGDLHTADLEQQTQALASMFAGRVSAAAPLTESHIALATLGGTLYRYNVHTATPTVVVELGQDVTNMSFDAFSGLLYVSLRDLSVITVDAFSGATAPFETMPGVGRVTVSPNGRLYFSPIGLLDAQPISSWDIPDGF